MVCFQCGKYGYSKEGCPDIVIEIGDIDTNLQPTKTQTAQPPPSEIDISPFGPWMVVEKRQRRNFKKASDSNDQNPKGIFSAPRFNPIYEVESDKNDEP
ncbi:hypothetical protein V6N13_053173 [Hibiscus sabdariffa]